MIRRLILAVTLALSAALAATPAPAEDLCIELGAIGPIPLSVPHVCVPVP